MRFVTWNVRSLCRAGSLTAAVRELARYKLDLVGVQKVRWDNGGTVRTGDYNFYGFYFTLHNDILCILHKHCIKQIASFEIIFHETLYWQL
jgi:exonuclease III